MENQLLARRLSPNECRWYIPFRDKCHRQVVHTKIEFHGRNHYEKCIVTRCPLGILYGHLSADKIVCSTRPRISTTHNLWEICWVLERPGDSYQVCFSRFHSSEAFLQAVCSSAPGCCSLDIFVQTCSFPMFIYGRNVDRKFRSTDARS